MDSSHFHPYQVKPISSGGFQINITPARKLTLIFSWRLLPIFILGMLLIVTQQKVNANQFSSELKIGFTIIAVAVSFLFLARIITQINISANGIELVTYRFLFTSTRKYNLADINHIHVAFYDHARSGTIFYKLKLRNGKSVQFMQQRTRSATQEDMKKVCHQLHLATKLKIEMRDVAI